MYFRFLKIISLFVLTLISVKEVKAQGDVALELERTVKKVVDEGYWASVRIWGYDTVKRVQNSAQFSGVVVTREGHILTVAHAIQPGNSYKVRFPDGREVIGKSLGKMDFNDNGIIYDLGMIKISGNGNWPVAQLGWSHSLKRNMPGVGISYQTYLNRLYPSVRFGRVVDELDKNGFIHTTCIMEPGDSGGPMFDNLGRVAGIHSQCGVYVDENFEVPVDVYRKYWTALNIPRLYKTFPEITDEIGRDTLAASLVLIDALEKPGYSLNMLDNRLSSSAIALITNKNGKQVRSTGTLVSMDSKMYVIGKSSELGDQVQVLSKGKSYPATSVGRDNDLDLVYLEIKKKVGEGLTKEDFFNSSDTFKLKDMGTFLISPLPGGRKVSVLSSTKFALPKFFSAGYFGASAQMSGGKVVINMVYPKSPADSVKIKAGDLIVGVNGLPVRQLQDFGRELFKYDPGDSINVECVRADSSFVSRIKLTRIPDARHTSELFPGGKSDRRDGFSRIFTHDADIRPDECGGPVFDSAGKFQGINISRFSRTTTVVVSPSAVWRSLQKHINGL